MQKTDANTVRVFRRIAFPVASFDYLKDYQRGLETRQGVRMTNNQALSLMMAEHKEATERGLLHPLGGVL